MLHLGIIGLAWLAARFVYGVDFTLVAEAVTSFVAARATALLVYAGLSAVTLPFVSLLFRGLGSYAVMYLLDRFCFWLGQFLVALLSAAAVIFWFETGVNLWGGLGATVALPFLVLASAAISLKLFDFNYPLKERLMGSLWLPVASLLIIWGSRILPQG
ncbi:MAG: hypothetical protein AB1413_09605 [Thermodesulfobacteriota bacterium]